MIHRRNRKGVGRKPAKTLRHAPTAIRKRVGISSGKDAPGVVDQSVLLSDSRSLIQSARRRVATVANSTTTLLFWHLGRRLLVENLQDERAQYGKRILAAVSRELTVEFGQAFGLRSLYRAIQFCQGFPDQEIVSTLSTQLGWSHFIELLPIKDPLAREFMRRCAASNVGMCARSDRRSAACCSNVRRYRESRMPSSRRSSQSSGMGR